MRLMLRFTIPVAKGNAAAADGALGAAIEALIEQVKPAAAASRSSRASGRAW
jgi:hypothetical protein